MMGDMGPMFFDFVKEQAGNQKRLTAKDAKGHKEEKRRIL